MKKSLADLVKARRLEAIAVDVREIQDLMAQAERSLEDAQRAIKGGLSADWQYMIAYTVPLSLAAAALRAEGYRPKGLGHHSTLFEALAISIPEARKDAQYFDRCRLKRNILMYKSPRSVTGEQVEQLFKRSASFQSFIRAWLKEKHPNLAGP
jgi:uncharacterized protein (UPF0332 family)